MRTATAQLQLHGAAASSHPHSIEWLPNNQVAYASHGIINLASNAIIEQQIIVDSTLESSTNNENETSRNVVEKEIKQNLIMNVTETLRTSTIPRCDNEVSSRVITSLAYVPFIDDENNNNNNNNDSSEKISIVLASTFSDGTINLWTKTQINEPWIEHVITGIIIDTTTIEKEDNCNSITNLDGVSYTKDNGDIVTILVAASALGVQLFVYEHSIYNTDNLLSSQPSLQQTIHLPNNIHKEIIGTYPCATVKIQSLDSSLSGRECLLASGTALPKSNRIYMHTLLLRGDNVNNNNNNNSLVQVKHQGYLSGHMGWITCLSFWKFSNGGYFLASGSHDSRIRLWRFHRPTVSRESGTNMNNNLESSNVTVDGYNVNDENVNDDADDNEDLIDEGEARLWIHLESSSSSSQKDTAIEANLEMAVILEALLIGHDEAIMSVAWRPLNKLNYQGCGEETCCLITSSMDRSILIWMAESKPNYIDMDQECVVVLPESMNKKMDGEWIPVSRVGSAGGILGGSIGSFLLGFVDARFSPDGKHIIGHGYGGSLHFWSLEGVRDEKIMLEGNSYNINDPVELASMERWRASPCVTGHFNGVCDISWEVSEGLYLLSVGLDQTCRLWSQISLPTTTITSDSEHLQIANKSKNQVIWREVGRPQVHGYDLMAVTCIGHNDERRHRFVSGADEKEARAFDAPLSTLHLLDKLHGTNEVWKSKEIENNQPNIESRVERAYLPSLGLSNRATAADAMEEAGDCRITPPTTLQLDSNETSLISNVVDLVKSLPHERDLGVASLWPEVSKLFGHQTELVCLTSNANSQQQSNIQVLVASSCKARDVESASIRLWEVDSSVCKQVLKGGHRSTVVAMSFSNCGQYLVSGGKDRRLCLWYNRKNNDEEDNFILVSAVDTAHKRIIWSVDFSNSINDGQPLIASGSRDGFVKIWHVVETECEEMQTFELKETHKFKPAYKSGKKFEAVTAVDFAPKSFVGSDSETYAILAIGLECGFIEVWSIPVTRGGTCELMHGISTALCHIGVVKKLAWKPCAHEKSIQSSSFKMTLASCGLDHGVRIFNIRLII